MKILRFNFCHPVKVRANFVLQSKDHSERSSIVINSNENIVELPVDKLGAGKWQVTLDWEHEGQIYTHQKDFEIKNRDEAF